MDALLLLLVGSVLSWLKLIAGFDLCPGPWAWTTSAFGALVGLSPTAGAVAVARLRLRRGARYPASGPTVPLIGLVTCGLLPWLAFHATGLVFRAARFAGFGLSPLDRSSLAERSCLGVSQRSYLGSVSVADALGGGALRAVLFSLPLVGFPLVTAFVVWLQARAGLRRGPHWPCRFFWLPVLGMALFTGPMPAGSTAQLWLGMVVGTTVGLFGVLLVPAPARPAPPARWTETRRPAPAKARPGPALPASPQRSSPSGRSSAPGPVQPRTAPAAGLPGAATGARGPGTGAASGSRGPATRTPEEPFAALLAAAPAAMAAARAWGAKALGRAAPAARDRARADRWKRVLEPPAGTTPPAFGPSAASGAPSGAPAPGARDVASGAPSGAPAPGARDVASAALPGAPAPGARDVASGAPLAADPGPLPRPSRHGTPAGPVVRTAGVPVPGPNGTIPRPRPPATLVEPSHASPAGHRFQLIRQLGAGGFGGVWLATDHRLGRRVAVKAALAPDHETEQRIRREARALGAVAHPNCVRILDLVDSRADPGLAGLRGLVIVMEYVEGQSLGELVISRGPVDDVTAARVWLRTAGALAAAHRCGVLHRDVKPSNVVLDPHGEPHLIDFGIARAPGDITLTMHGMVIGTPDFLAPETARGERATPSSDAWQLAATICFALTGVPPRGGHPDAVSALRAAAAGTPPSHVPRRCAHRQLLTACLAADPRARPDLAEVRRRLERWLSRSGVPARR